MDFDTVHRENLVLYSKLFEENPQIPQMDDHEGFPVGFSSGRVLDHLTMECSSYPHPNLFHSPFYDPFDPFQSSFGKLNPASFAEETVPNGHTQYGFQSRRSVLSDLGSKSSFQTDEKKILDDNAKRKRSDPKKKEPTQTRRKRVIDKKSYIIKGQWTTDEDRLLEKLVEKHGVRKWSSIAQMLPGRIGKQCRERWHNHLKPNIKKDRWSDEEDRILIESHRQVGNRWAEIARSLPGRSENTIKNHWNATKRRQLSSRKNNSSISPLQDYIRNVISSNVNSDRDHLDSSSSGSISPSKKLILENPADTNAGNHESVEAQESFLDAQIGMQFDFQKEMDFMEMLSIGYI